MTFLKFLLVGGLATALHYGITALLWLGAGVSLVVASGLGFVTSALLNYLLNARLTFKSTASHTQTLPRFMVVALMGLCINSLLLWSLLALLVPAVVSQVLATVGVLLWNFLANARWTFRKVPASG